MNSIPIHSVDSEQNPSNVEATIFTNIQTKPGIVENIHVGESSSPYELDTYHALFREFRDVFTWSYEEIPGIDSIIIEHEIKMYLDVKAV